MRKLSLEDFQLYAPAIFRGLEVQGKFLRHLSASDFQFKMPIQPTSNNSKTVMGIEVFPLSRNGREIFLNLLWHCLFGRKSFKVYHWFCLFRLLERIGDKNEDKLFLGLYVILKLSYTGKPGKTNFGTNHRSVKGTLSKNANLLTFRDADKELSVILRFFTEAGITIPQKGKDLRSLLSIRKTAYLKTKPKQPNRVGVGYKDKGSLGEPGNEYDPWEPTWYPHLDFNVWKHAEKYFDDEFPNYMKFNF